MYSVYNTYLPITLKSDEFANAISNPEIEIGGTCIYLFKSFCGSITLPENRRNWTSPFFNNEYANNSICKYHYFRVYFKVIFPFVNILLLASQATFLLSVWTLKRGNGGHSKYANPIHYDSCCVYGLPSYIVLKKKKNLG